MLKFLNLASGSMKEDPEAVSAERGLQISADLFHGFAQSKEQFTRVLTENRKHLLWGTDYVQ